MLFDPPFYIRTDAGVEGGIGTLHHVDEIGFHIGVVCLYFMTTKNQDSVVLVQKP